MSEDLNRAERLVLAVQLCRSALEHDDDMNGLVVAELGGPIGAIGALVDLISWLALVVTAEIQGVDAGTLGPDVVEPALKVWQESFRGLPR